MLKYLLSVSLLFPLACSESEDTDLKWGHLNSGGLSPNAPQFLINQKPETNYEICLPSYLEEKFSGIESELSASVNIWARSIGRSIPVTFKRVSFDKPQQAMDPNQQMRQLYDVCGDDVNLVVGLSYFGGGTMGATGSSWRSRGSQIVSYQRYLFLRDFSVGQHPYYNEWVSLQELEGVERSADDILDMMEAKDKTVLDPEGTPLTLPVLVHEMGHVWGLCDQYESVDNCDPMHSSQHKDFSSIMAASSRLSKLYLTPDDEIGIQKLAQRDGFNQHWPETVDVIFKEVDMTQKEVLYFDLRSVNRTGSNAEIDFGVVTKSKGGSLEIQYKVGSNWRQMSTINSNGPFNYPVYTFNARGYAPYEIRMILSLEGEEEQIIEGE